MYPNTDEVLEDQLATERAENEGMTSQAPTAPKVEEQGQASQIHYGEDFPMDPPMEPVITDRKLATYS